MTHEHHTKEHQAFCISAARQLSQAVNKMLEASQYEWTAVARPTMVAALADIALATGNVNLGLRKVDKKEGEAVPAISTPGQWPVSSS